MESSLASEAKRVTEARQYWDDFAATFDDEPDHGLRDPRVFETWRNFLKENLPQEKSTILDIGCGTGSLSVILAGVGHRVTGIDVSPEMIAHAKTKAASQGLQIDFSVMDAAFPNLQPAQFDVIVCRHLLWALPEPEQVLQRWVRLLKQHGRLILIEGYWGTGVGLHASEITAILPSSSTSVSVQDLSADPNFWGRDVADERYAIIVDIKK